MSMENAVMAKNAVTIVVIDAPEVSLAPDENPAELLLHFYRALGWNGDDILDPCKIRTTDKTYNRLYEQMYERCPNAISVGMFMVNRGPSVDANIPTGKVHLLDGWIKPAPKEGDSTYAA